MSLLLTATMLFSAGVSEKGAAKDLTEITVMVYERGNEYPSGDSTVNNRLTRWINSNLEKDGVRVTFIPIVRSGADNTINSMLAANNAPDVIMTYDKERVATYGSQGGLIDLAPYVDRLDPDWLANAKTALLQTQFEGKQYALPRVFEIYGRSHNQYIRKDIVEAMGKKVPTTRAELIDVLYAAKKAYPNMIPYAFSGKITDGKYTNFILSYTSRGWRTTTSEPTFTNIPSRVVEGLRQPTARPDGIIPRDFASMWTRRSTSRAWRTETSSSCWTATGMRRSTPTPPSRATRCGRSTPLRMPMATT